MSKCYKNTFLGNEPGRCFLCVREMKWDETTNTPTDISTNKTTVIHLVNQLISRQIG